MRSRRVSGPGRSGSGWIDGTSGTAVAEPRPLARKLLERAAVELHLPDADASAPAAAYARRSSAKLAVSVLTCEIENRGGCCSTLDTGTGWCHGARSR